jgi:hypothetical protein
MCEVIARRGAVLSAEVTSQYTLSCMKLARNAHIGNLSRIFRMKSNKSMILPSSLLLGLFGYWVIEDHFRAMEYLEHYWLIIALPIACGLPIVMFGLRLVGLGRQS